MSTEINQEAVATPEVSEESTVEANPELDSLKADLQNRDEMIGSLKRELKDAKKAAKETKTVEQEPQKSDDTGLLQKFDKLALRTEGITDEDEVELANKLKEETGKDMEDLLNSKYFKSELEALRETKANVAAAAGVKGSAGSSNAKQTPEYWIAKGTPPSREDVPDRKTRAAIARAMMADQKDGRKFYSD